MFDSLRPHRLQPARLLCSWGSPGKNTGVGCQFLFQGIVPDQGSNLYSLRGRQILYHWATREAHDCYWISYINTTAANTRQVTSWRECWRNQVRHQPVLLKHRGRVAKSRLQGKSKWSYKNCKREIFYSSVGSCGLSTPASVYPQPKVWFWM